MKFVIDVRALAAAGLFVAAMIGGVRHPASAMAQPACSDTEIVFARGTNEEPGVGEIGQAFVDALGARLPGETIGVYGVDYPASYDFEAAVQGVVDATNRLTALSETCPNTKIVLGGYSQGAAVAGYTLTDTLPPGFTLPPGLTGPLPAAVASHVTAVVLFGNPKPGVIRLLARSAPPVNIAPAYRPKVLQLCAPRDPICDSGLDRKAHRAYLDNGMIEQSADFAARTVNTPSEG